MQTPARSGHRLEGRGTAARCRDQHVAAVGAHTARAVGARGGKPDSTRVVDARRAELVGQRADRSTRREASGRVDRVERARTARPQVRRVGACHLHRAFRNWQTERHPRVPEHRVAAGRLAVDRVGDHATHLSRRRTKAQVTEVAAAIAARTYEHIAPDQERRDEDAATSRFRVDLLAHQPPQSERSLRVAEQNDAATATVVATEIFAERCAHVGVRLLAHPFGDLASERRDAAQSDLPIDRRENPAGEREARGVVLGDRALLGVDAQRCLRAVEVGDRGVDVEAIESRAPRAARRLDAQALAGRAQDERLHRRSTGIALQCHRVAEPQRFRARRWSAGRCRCHGCENAKCER
ncbi:hypothetical protein HRbin41_01571 [bacterium HR41]|nr:hypothetical protein HRbin41_01571 [bacterium HR41]